MAVVSVDEIYEDRKSSLELAGEKHTRAFVVRLDSAIDGSRLAMLAVGVGLGSGFPGGGVAQCSSITADQHGDSPLTFRVSVEYETPKPGEGTSDNPDDDLPQLKIGTYKYNKALEKDEDGNPLVASNGEPFDPPVESERAFLTITLSRTASFPAFDPKTDGKYVDYINTDKVFGYEKYQVKVDDVSATTKTIKGVTWWDLSVTLMIADDWRVNLLDVGTYEVTVGGSTGGGVGRTFTERKRILDDNGQPIGKPVLLDGNGKKKLDNNPVNAPGSPFRLNKEVDLSAWLSGMGFPTTFNGYSVF